MQIEQIRIKNFRVFKDVEMRNIPRLAILVGANGTGKSTLFAVFGFLRDAMNSNVRTALSKLGRSRGFSEVRSRDANGPIEIEIKYRVKSGSPLVTYSVSIGWAGSKPVVERQILRYRRFSRGKPWHFLDFKEGKGFAVTNEAEEVTDETQLERDEQTLKSSDLLAIKGLAQFERFPAVVALGNLIERWHVSDFRISRARSEQESGYAEHLSREGENLSLVIEFVSTHTPDFLNGAQLEEVFWLQKEGGYATLKRASENEQVAAYMQDGDQMGYLWKQGFFEGADPHQGLSAR